MERYEIALLVEKFHLNKWDIARYSDAQIEQFFFYPRDEHGLLKRPGLLPDASAYGDRYTPAKSMEEDLAKLGALHEHLKGTEGKLPGLANYEQAVEALKLRWA